MAFSGMMMGLLCKAGVPAAAAIVLGLLSAVLIGMVNGLVISYGKINSFIVTLSMMTILRGLILIWTNSNSIFGFGPVFTFLGSGKIGPINMPIVISLVVAVIRCGYSCTRQDLETIRYFLDPMKLR